MESSRDPCNLVNSGLDMAYLWGCQASALVWVTMRCCSPCHDFLCAIPVTSDPLQNHVTVTVLSKQLIANILLSLALLHSRIVVTVNPWVCWIMVSSAEGKSWDVLFWRFWCLLDVSDQQVTRSTEWETEVMITHIKTVKTTHQGAMEMKVETIVRHQTHSSKTTLGTSQECSPSARQSPVATVTTLPSPPSTPTTTCKSQLGSTIVASPPMVSSSSTSCATGIPHPLDLWHLPSTVEAYYLVIVGQEVGIYYTW